MKQPGFFDVEERLARLSGLGDQLEAFSRTVDFEVFRPDLEKALAYADGSKGGRPPVDPVLMFKILVIQTLNNLFDERTEVACCRFRGHEDKIVTKELESGYDETEVQP
jgi:transposase, IS5 family